MSSGTHVGLSPGERGAGGTGKRRPVILYAILPGMKSKLSLMDGRLRCENEAQRKSRGRNSIQPPPGDPPSLSMAALRVRLGTQELLRQI